MLISILDQVICGCQVHSVGVHVVRQRAVSQLNNNFLYLNNIGGSHTFNINSSSTCKLSNKTFYIIYGDDTNVTGMWANDTVSVRKNCLLCQGNYMVVFYFISSSDWWYIYCQPAFCDCYLS
jgi:hypothetical protein